jgi:hypothetical protein
VGGDPNALANNVVLSSPDGVTWTVRSTGSTDILQDVAWTGSLLVAVGQYGTILTSPENLTPLAPPLRDPLRNRKSAAARTSGYDMTGALRWNAASKLSRPSAERRIPPGAYVLKDR